MTAHDYIRREDAVEIVESILSSDYDMYSAVCDACSMLEKMPADNDVRENVKAKKVIGGGERDGATCWFECSHCHGTVDLQDMFCKHCGAVLEYEK